MRRYRFTFEARDAFDGQLDCLVSRHAISAATALNARVHGFIRDTLCQFPATGRFLQERNLWETWIPRTKLIVWYVYDDELLTVVSIWHTAQDRGSP